jgi:O-antigen ligase
MFSLAILAFVAIPVEYTNIVFTTTTRWIFLAALMLYLLAKRRLMSGFQSLFGASLLVYCAWCMSTYSWSEVPQLSLEKAAAFSMIAVAFVSAGQEWIDERGSFKALTYLAPVTAVALLAGYGGGDFSSVVAGPGSLQAVQGLTDNPNMLGSLIAMSLPLLLWGAYRYRVRPQMRWVYFALVLIAVVMLVRTYSRSAIMSAGILGVGFCSSLKLKKTGFMLVLIAAALLLAGAAGTAIVDATYKDYILKGGTVEQGILFSRSEVWQQSYENAKQGGWFGVGYGATAGDMTFQGGMTAVGYGREKGNTQLAIIEETGIVGLVLYLVMLFALFKRLVLAHRRERTPELKVALGIIIGALAGLTVMSVFEAWWVAPGSAESAYFWSLAGVGLGLTPRPVAAAKKYGLRRVAQERLFQPAQFLPHRRMKAD